MMKRIAFALAVVTLTATACDSETVGLDDADGPLVQTVDGGSPGPDARLIVFGDAPPSTTGDGATGLGIADARGASGDASVATLPVLKSCIGQPFMPAPKGDWNHGIVSAAIALGAPAHGAMDILASGAGTGTARFQYSLLLKDLEDEKVRVFINRCDGWHDDGIETTDGDGAITHAFSALPYGVYDVRYQVVGDATVAAARLWALPKDTHLTVFDIDGTLTTGDSEIIREVLAEIFSGSYAPEAYSGARDLTVAWNGRTAIPVYLTGRPGWIAPQTRTWLDGLGFAAGPVVLAPTTADAVPTNSGVGDFKKDALNNWKAAGFKIDVAYGNATTDIYAYLGLGLAPGNIWIIGAHAGEQGTQAVKGSWTAHAVDIVNLPPIQQPFTR